MKRYRAADGRWRRKERKMSDLISREKTLKYAKMKIKGLLADFYQQKHVQAGGFTIDAVLTLFEKIIQSAPDAEQWIPCEEIIEELEDKVLCCDNRGNELIGWLHYNDNYDCWVCESDECVMYDTIAWRPKPKPYEEKKNENIQINHC